MIVFDSYKCKCHKGKTGKSFTLIELLTVISIISLLLSILLPSLRKARQQGQSAVCKNNIKQLGLAFILYGEDYNGYAMPMGVWQEQRYWWGKILIDRIDHKQGFTWSYIRSELGVKSVYECPAQPYGSYRLQGGSGTDDPKWITSTYGYNGYFLCPSQSGWPNLANFTNLWQKIININMPSKVLAFTDTLIDFGSADNTDGIYNIALLDPPKIYNSGTGEWVNNGSPTTCFRHNEKTNAIFVDGHCEPMTTKGAPYSSPLAKIGSIGTDNAPYYVPNYLQWPKRQDRRR